MVTDDAYGYNEPMDISDNVSLADYSTMHLGGSAAHLTHISSREGLRKALEWAAQQQLPVLVIGGGSNIVWRDEGFPGLVIVNEIKRYEVLEASETTSYLTVGAGEIWDSVVERSVAGGLTGIEALSLIPGTAGATPIQNVGAYGQEISQTLITVEAFDTQVNDFVTLRGSECGFDYRTSRFKTTDRGRFYITGLTLHVLKDNPAPPFYGAIQRYFEEHSITEYTPAALRAAVIAIRTSKLPDPTVVHNAGSFFANPIVDQQQFFALQAQFPTVPSWPAANDQVKISAAWLIEQAGFKAVHDETTGMATWSTQPLVLVNEHAQTTADLLAFKQKIADAVKQTFSVTLIQEPELLP